MPHPRSEYRVELDGERCFVTDRGVPLELPRAWTPEHVLAALIRCTFLSLAYHAQRAHAKVSSASGSARGAIAQREDGLYAFVEIDCDLDVRIEPPPADVAELLTKAERGCFIGSSLAAKPRYRWRVNGAGAAA
ncbi:MAG: OsmC family protein [Gaiellaceae bacterium]